MTAEPGHGDLRELYERPGDSPVTRDDYVDRERVIGFALTVDPEPADQMLIDGEEGVAVPSRRPVPCAADPRHDIRRTGPSPVQNLDPGCLHQAAAGFREAVEEQLIALGEGGDLIRSLLTEIADRNHLAWLVGGAVRDLIADGPGACVNDLDFAGTIGPAKLAQIAPLRRSGTGDYEWKISPRLVWSVTAPENPGERVLEYKPLAQTGFRFPAWGGDLACDAATRDLTVNALYYDRGEGVVADPTGRGLADLLGTPRRAVPPYQGDDPAQQACIILRCLKFRFRWRDLDTTEMAAWVGALPGDTVARVPAGEWKYLLALRNRCIPRARRGQDERAMAAELGQPAVLLVEKLHEMAAG